MIYSNLKKLDLHGECKEIAIVLINQFINECYKSGIYECEIIHGKGTGVIKKTVQETLKKNKLIENYYIDFFNDGSTIVKIKKIIDKK